MLNLHKCVKKAGTNIDHLLTLPLLSIAASGPKNPELLAGDVSELLNRHCRMIDLRAETLSFNNEGLHELICGFFLWLSILENWLLL